MYRYLMKFFSYSLGIDIYGVAQNSSRDRVLAGPTAAKY